MTELRALTTDSIDDVVAFMREANPFAERTWGWDTGRFVDWRWGGNTAREAAQPGWFSRHGRFVASAGEIQALVISEYGDTDLCIITKQAEHELVAAILSAVIDERRQEERSLSLEAATRSEWLREVFIEEGLDEHTGVSHEWEFDLTTDLEPSAPPAGFEMSSLADARPGDREGIADCISAAFGTSHDVAHGLRSIEANPLFRPELSVYVRSPDGRVAAYCRGSADPGNGVCGIDPVCTHPDFQRLGLARTVVLRCFEQQRGLGGESAFIGSAPEPAPGNRLYRALGPRQRIDMSSWTLPTGGPSRGDADD